MTKHKKPALKREQPSMFSSLSPTKQDLLCVLFLYGITLFLFRGIIFENGAFAAGGDTATAVIFEKAGNHIAATEKIDPVWMPYFFSGMPTFGNMAYIPHAVSYLQNIIVRILNLFYLNGTWTWLVVYSFLSGVFMFFFMRVMKFARTASLLAALTFMLSPYAIGLAGEGHGSKLMALSYLPLVFMLTHLLFERRDVLSFGLLAASIGTLLLTNHVQIVYYVFIVIGLYLLYQIILDIRVEKLLVVKKSALLAGALIIGFFISSYIYLSLHEYAQYSIRGGGTTGAPGGLTYEYATNWSWHPAELVTLLVPSFFGLQMPYYWGTIEPWTNSSVYVGILPIFLSIIALVYRRNATTVFFGLLTAIVVLMSFGRNFSLFYGLLFDYLPFFNKFRAPAMVLHLLAFTLGILGAHGFAYLIEVRDRPGNGDPAKLKRFLLYGATALGLFLVLIVLTKGSLLTGFADFTREGEQQELQQQYGARTPQVMAQLKQERIDLLWKDLVKFSLIGLASCGAIWLFLSKKISAGVFSAAVLGILLVDLTIMDMKFISPKPASALEQSNKPDATVTFLRQDTTLFRVFPLGQQFQDNTFAYHEDEEDDRRIQSIGGYSPAKLKIYQTMLDSCLYKGADPNFPINMNIVNMLNVRYIYGPFQLPQDRLELVYTDQAKRMLTYRNPSMLPRAFFVKGVMVAGNEHEVFQILNSPMFDAGTTAVVEKPLPEPVTAPDSAIAEVREFASRRIVLDAFTSSPSLLVLSEVYYPAGWKATIDGTETEIYKTNYILRSVVLPAGKHEVVFTFDPPMYATGYALTHVGWGVVLICIAIGLIPTVRARVGRQRAEQAHG